MHLNFRELQYVGKWLVRFFGVKQPGSLPDLKLNRDNFIAIHDKDFDLVPFERLHRAGNRWYDFQIVIM